jgi:multiple sugar transport system substrate-binding protein
MKRTFLRLSACAVGIGLLTACGGTGGVSASEATAARGPITIWYSNNDQEIAWGKQAVDAWNAAHPDEQVSAQQIPAGKSSEEVIGAAITAGTEPCLIFNTSPASVPQFQKQAGLVALNDFPDAQSVIETRSGQRAAQYRSPDGKYYQLPWKANPVMIFYNKKAFAAAGIDANNPPLRTHDEFLNTARRLVSSGAAKYAILPSPTSEFYQAWFDFYPMFAAESGGRQLVADGKAQFDGTAGTKVAAFWRTLYAENLAGKEKYNGDAFADGTAAMSIVGPYAISTYDGKVDWGVVPVPTSTGTTADQVHTFSDAKNIAMYVSCRNRATAWDFLKFATSVEQDGQLLELTGQMPIRVGLAQTYASYLAKHPAYATFAAQSARTVEVPNVSNSITIWQTFRDAWSASVIFGTGDPAQALARIAGQVNDLVGQR